MAKRVLAIVKADQPYGAENTGPSGLVEHTLALRRAGADVHLLLRGGAVTYGVRGQEAVRQGDVVSLVHKGNNVYYVEDDARAHSIAAEQLVAGLKPVRSDDLPALLHSYEQVWHW